MLRVQVQLIEHDKKLGVGLGIGGSIHFHFDEEVPDGKPQPTIETHGNSRIAVVKKNELTKQGNRNADHKHTIDKDSGFDCDECGAYIQRAKELNAENFPEFEVSKAKKAAK